jgi:hypothetical protein
MKTAFVRRAAPCRSLRLCVRAPIVPSPRDSTSVKSYPALPCRATNSTSPFDKLRAGSSGHRASFSFGWQASTTPKKIPPPATRTAHNLDLNTVTIPFTAHDTPAPGNHCRVFLRGHALYALTNPAGKPRRTRYSLHQPLSHGLSSLSSLNSHISAKTFPRRPRPHLSTTTITHPTHRTRGARRHHRCSGLCRIVTTREHRCSGLYSPPASPTSSFCEVLLPTQVTRPLKPTESLNGAPSAKR